MNFRIKTINPLLLQWATSAFLLSNLMPACAGMPNGPFVVFSDLGLEKSGVKTIIQGYMDSDRGGNFCDDIARSPLIFMRKRPTGLEDPALRLALLGSNKAEINKVRQILKNYRLKPDIDQGLDGVVAYANDENPKMIGLGLKGGLKVVQLKRGASKHAVIKAFCEAIPPILRD